MIIISVPWITSVRVGGLVLVGGTQPRHCVPQSKLRLHLTWDNWCCTIVSAVWCSALLLPTCAAIKVPWRLNAKLWSIKSSNRTISVQVQHLSLLNYLLTPRSTVFLEKLIGAQLVNEFPAFYGTRRFITAFTSARHLSLSWARSIQSIPHHPTSWRSTLILSSHLRLGLPSCLFRSGFPTKPCTRLSSPPIHATCPALSFFSIPSPK